MRRTLIAPHRSGRGRYRDSCRLFRRDDRVTFRVFHVNTGEFLGTEMIVHEDVFKGQPCPTDPPSRQYTYLGPILGLPYYACHRYDSPF